MFVQRLIFLVVLFWLSPPVSALNPQDILPPDQAFKFSATAVAPDKLELVWEIAEGYHLYREKLEFRSQTATLPLEPADLPEGRVEHDAVLGDTAVYRGTLKVELPFRNADGARQIQLFAKYQGCADIGVCYPPQKVVLDLPIPAAAATRHGPKGLMQGFRSLAPELFEQPLLPAEQAFQFFANVKDDHTIEVSWLAADGYFLYKDKLALELDSPNHNQLQQWRLPTGEPHDDPEFGQVEIYRGELAFGVNVLRNGTGAETAVLTAQYQGCADRGVCYPPMRTAVQLALPASTAVAGPPAPAPPSAASEEERIVYALKTGGFSATLLSFFGFGILLAFTPCIFPMIPILSGIIVGHGETITTRKAFLLSLCYVAASAAMYTIFGILAALFGSNLQAAMQNPWVIGAFSAVFVLLALSMFGFYHLQLPAPLQAVLRRISDRHRNRSYYGAGIMGALSSLIVGPCVAAPLAAALLYIGQTGNVLLGGSALFAMGIGMGFPLLLIGASAGGLLPKAGAWLEATRMVFGVVMLAVAVWMLSRIVPPDITMLLSAMLLIVPAVFLSALDPLPYSASGWRKLWKGLSVVMLVLGVLELIGLSAGSRNIRQPLQGLVSGGIQAETGLVFEPVRTPEELADRLAQAAAQGRKVMLDFYADWCVSCKEMEAYTFADPEVARQLAEFVLLRADVTANSQSDKALLQQFGLIGPPGVIFFTDGREAVADRVVGYQDTESFLQRLRQLSGEIRRPA